MSLIENDSKTNLELNKKFQMYNSLFLNLYYQESNPVGHLIPLLTHFAKQARVYVQANPICRTASCTIR